MKKLLLLLVCLGFSAAMMGQCAMCRATAEQASEKNSGIAEGLNSGIVYLMLLPYLLFMIGGLVFFRKKIAAFFKN
jgi:amino acid transporter